MFKNISVENVDLYNYQFWVFLAVVFVLMNAFRQASIRTVVFAFLNLVFLFTLVKTGVALLLAALVIIYVTLKACERGYRFALILGGLATFGLFVAHKLPSYAGPLGGSPIAGILSAIGYSYVALRLIDVGRAVVEGRHPAPGFFSLLNYLLPFHMLSAGPIQSYDEFVGQPKELTPSTIPQTVSYLSLIAAGLFKKFVLADIIERVFLTNFGVGGAYIFLEAQLKYIWVYLDFSAYSDIALGIGGMIGVATPRNFNRPYVARNVIDYWERWHISLSQFIRRNLFIPLQLWLMRQTGGSHPLRVASFAFFVSFFLCGLWHSISLNWMLWGVCQAIGLIICNLYKYYLTKKLGKARVNRYLANPWIRALAIFITFEFIAATLVVATYPLDNLFSHGASR